MQFKDDLTFSTFLRTVVTFCMFSAEDMVGWMFNVVATNVIALAEKSAGPPPPAGRAGARGVDRARNKSVYWKDAVAWQGLSTADSSDRISVQAFSNLLYSMHPPTSSLAITVGRAIEKCTKLAVLGGLRLFQFRQITEEYPTLLAPVFLMQTAMRTKLLGQQWWADKRQIFKDARDLVQDEEDNVLRAKILEKQAAAAQRAKEEREAKRREKKAAKLLRAGGGARAKREGRTDSDTDTGTGSGTEGSDSDTGTATRSWMARMGVGTGAITGTPATDTGGRTSSAAGTGTSAGGGGSGGGGRAGTDDLGKSAKTVTSGPGAGRTVTVYNTAAARTQTKG